MVATADYIECRRCKTLTVGIVAQTTSRSGSMHQIAYSCLLCKQCTVATRLPGASDYDFGVYENVADDEQLTAAIERESFRLGLPKPDIRKVAS